MHPRHLFVIDPLPSLNPVLDSSLRMMQALAKRGHLVYVCEQKSLRWSNRDATAAASTQAVTFGAGASDWQAGPAGVSLLSDFNAIHMRKDPPYDMDYIATTWLLETAGQARIYNSPEALRRFNEKLAILLFPKETRPALASADPDALWTFAQKEARGDAILKPLTLFGGRGVIRLQLQDASPEVIMKTLQEETAGGTALRLIQPFDTAIFAGEVRAFTAFGKAVGWCLKKPADGQFLANTRAGAVITAYQPTPVEVARVESVAKTLLKDGVTFIGFDLIGGYVSEINITSPRLLLGSGDRSDPYGAIAEMIEADLRSMI